MLVMVMIIMIIIISTEDFWRNVRKAQMGFATTITSFERGLIL
jgi:hypothetical protein